MSLPRRNAHAPSYGGTLSLLAPSRHGDFTLPLEEALGPEIRAMTEEGMESSP